MRLTSKIICLIGCVLVPTISFAKGEQANHNAACYNQKINCQTNKHSAQKSVSPPVQKHKVVTQKHKAVTKHQKQLTKKKPTVFRSGPHIVTSKRLNIRAQPTTNSPIVGALRHGMKITVIRQHGAWREIVFNKQHVWVYAAYLKAIQ
ncbi:MAG: SH3 domain-containing protein [Marinomonas sp.]|uniref:SH3 domain-containing protein n=1 Tax=unclassified Marinomonas TaxID=196814 RepID=UPI0037C80689